MPALKLSTADTYRRHLMRMIMFELFQLVWWFWYGKQNPCTGSFGAHGNDWEHITINFIKDGSGAWKQDSVTWFQHDGWYTRSNTATSPSVYVGKNAHGSYDNWCDGKGFVWEQVSRKIDGPPPENRRKTDGGCLQRSRRIISKCLYILQSCYKENNRICVIVFSQYNWKLYKTNLTLYCCQSEMIEWYVRKKLSEMKLLFASGSANIGRRYSLQ